MTLSKDRLRKIHGVTESTAPADQAVLAKYHEAAANWLARISFFLHAIFAAIGFAVVLLPILSRSWRAIIESTPLVRVVFHDYSTFGGLAMANLYILMALFLIRNVVDMELFPRTRREEFAYWADISFGFVGATLWLFLPFGVLAYFINIGG